MGSHKIPIIYSRNKSLFQESSQEAFHHTKMNLNKYKEKTISCITSTTCKLPSTSVKWQRSNEKINLFVIQDKDKKSGPLKKEKT